ncbi:MAG: spore germination protein [Alicyclobacillus sp.]|nr:spore germination protein [Alicyclobacillus sp.]
MRPTARHMRVGARELTSMTTVLIATNAFLSYPAISSSAGLEAAWMEPLWAGGMAILAFLIIDMMFRRYFPGQDLLEVAHRTFGKAVGGFIAIAYAAYFIWTTAVIMRQFAETVIITVLPNTPIVVVVGLFTVTMCYVASCGLEAICRLGQLTFPLVSLGIISAVCLTGNWWQPTFLMPLWGNGVGAVFRGSLYSASSFINVLLLCLIYPHAKDYRDLRRVGLWSTVWGMLLLTVFVVGYHLVFAPELTSKMASPIYSMARLVHIGRFLQRVESVYVFIWVAAAVIHLSITLWAASYVLSGTFNWPTHRPILPALGLACLTVGMTQPDIATVIRSQRAAHMTWAWAVIFVVPILLLAVGALRVRGRPRPKPS